jgi:hypothetical protein
MKGQEIPKTVIYSSLPALSLRWAFCQCENNIRSDSATVSARQAIQVKLISSKKYLNSGLTCSGVSGLTGVSHSIQSEGIIDIHEPLHLA